MLFPSFMLTTENLTTRNLYILYVRVCPRQLSSASAYIWLYFFQWQKEWVPHCMSTLQTSVSFSNSNVVSDISSKAVTTHWSMWSMYNMLGSSISCFIENAECKDYSEQQDVSYWETYNSFNGMNSLSWRHLLVKPTWSHAFSYVFLRVVLQHVKLLRCPHTCTMLTLTPLKCKLFMIWQH